MSKATPGKRFRNNRALWLALAVVAFICIGAGLLAWNSGLIPGKPINTTTEQKVYDKAISNLDLRLDSGDVEIRAGMDDQVTIERHFKWTADKPVFTETWDGTKLSITGICPGEQLNCSLRHVITVPASTIIAIQTEAGNISVTGLLNDMRLNTVAGNVRLTDAEGRLEIKTTDGAVNATDLRSNNASIETTSGNITLGFTSAPLEVTAKAESGDIIVDVPDNKSYNVSAETNAGRRDVSVQQDSMSQHAVKIQVTAGDVVVRPVE